MKTLLQLRNIKRYYAENEIPVKALDDVSLTIHAGEFIAIMGQSGSGKSTLMNIIGCLDRPTEGSYQVLGREASSLGKDELAALRSQTFGFIFQRYNLLATSTASENVEIPAMYAGLDKSKRKSRAKELLTSLGLGDRGGHRPSQLSGGQQQRVAIARALMNDPPVILADEPTGALDSKSGQDVMALLKDLHAQGRTIILITHDEHVASHAKRIVRIQDGKIIEDTLPVSSAQAVDSLDPRFHEESNKGVAMTADAGEAVTTALRSLRVNKFRTALTLLGVIIGVAAVVTMLAIGNGSKKKVLDQISAMGTNILSVRPGAPGIRSSGDIATMTLDDAKAIEDLPNIETVVGERSSRSTLRLGNIDYATSVQGVSPGFPIARDWPVEEGNFFTVRDVESYAPVMVLGKTVANNFFPNGEDPIGKYILVGNIPFQVIGVLKTKGAAPWGGDQDDSVYIPITTGLIRIFGQSYLSGITVKVTSTETIEETQSAIEELLKRRHRTEDFFVRNTASILETADQTMTALTILLGAIAGISLLVGGIGVMNIMLVSVTERTREIGIRMATGARMRDILIQFNTEAAVVCTIGGIIGIGIGFFAAWIISLLGVDVIFSPTPSLLAFSCAVLTGIVFGYLPARKAAHLDPVVALSSE
ncbi:MAG: macrolide ABC transporter permease/ATP-binding protein MacB [Micavibrio aeruginosavorus]|uniref:Pyoverdine export ATP-binding/permease protein PvdT n=1 Tax=Micavibrio aeruginosavorus TaxID=349221 RepID=A0A2W5FLD8_9BACT|nr:MAG: macrolide ABC transporter permease/ATP-binding protein MacB [Micavibrio aeruginosavorus]